MTYTEKVGLRKPEPHPPIGLFQILTDEQVSAFRAGFAPMGDLIHRAMNAATYDPAAVKAWAESRQR